MEAILAVGIIGSFFAAIGIAILYEGKRKKAFNHLADSMNLSFDGKRSDESGDFIKSINHLAQFQRKDQSVKNIIYGEVKGVNLAIFDHTFTLKSSNPERSGSVCSQTVIIFQSESLNLPFFSLRLKGASQPSVKKECKDIFFDSHSYFSQKYDLYGHDEDAIRSVFNSDFINFFERSGNWAVDASSNSLMVGIMRKGRKVAMGGTAGLRPQIKKIAVKDINYLLQRGFEVFNLLKT